MKTIKINFMAVQIILSFLYNSVNKQNSFNTFFNFFTNTQNDQVQIHEMVSNCTGSEFY